MPTTPLWITLLVAGLGVLGSGATAILVQRRADRRQDVQWDRELQREREARAIATTATIAARRQEAYLQFLKKWEERYTNILSAKEAAPLDHVAPQHLTDLYPYLVEVQIFGTRKAAALATAAHEVLSTWSHGPSNDDLDDFSDLVALREQIREDLFIPDGRSSEH